MIPAVIVGAVIAGLITGLIVGKSQVKRSRPGYKPLLSRKEKIVYSALFVGGTALVLLGVFLKFPAPVEQSNDTMTFDQTAREALTKNIDSVDKADGAASAEVAVAVIG